MAPRTPRSAEIEISSRLEAPPAQVWDRVTTPEGIVDEMRPYLRMTVPAGVEKLDPENIELGKKIGRSWILLFGLIPFDYERLDAGPTGARPQLPRVLADAEPAIVGTRTHP